MRRTLTIVLAAIVAVAVAAVPVQAGKGHHRGKQKLPAYALSKSGRSLVTFDAKDPGDARYVGRVKGLADGERLVGIDFRPRTGDLIGVGSQSNVYTLDLRSARATRKSSLAVMGTPVVLAGDSYGVDFNPTVDRLRVTSDAEQNLRINVDTGATTVDKPLAYAAMDANAGADPSVVGSAYINNDSDEIVVPPAPPTPGTTGTMLFAIDAGRDSLALQNPPNDGVLNTVGKLGVRTSKVVGFDVFSKIEAGKAVANTAYASLRWSGRTRLYRVDLATGDADRVHGYGRSHALRHVGDIAVKPQR